MAYLNLLAVVTNEQLTEIAHHPGAVVTPSLVVGVSHVIASWVQPQPLGLLLAEALDGGQPLHPQLWHPLRAPGYHDASRVQSLMRELEAAWLDIQVQHPDLPTDDWYREQIERVLHVFRTAAASLLPMISVLDAPYGGPPSERAYTLFSTGTSESCFEARSNT